MVRTSVPDSNKWTAKACRSEWGVIGFGMPHRRRAFWHACSTAALLMGRPGRSPGKSQCLGRSTRHQSRRMSSSVGESIT